MSFNDRITIQVNASEYQKKVHKEKVNYSSVCYTLICSNAKSDTCHLFLDASMSGLRHVHTRTW